MSSTDERDVERAAREFFTEVIVPLADEIRESKLPFFPLGPDAALESYFSEPARKVMAREDFHLPASESIQQFIKAVADHWANESNPELARMAEGLIELAANITLEEGESDEVSPFIYVMF